MRDIKTIPVRHSSWEPLDKPQVAEIHRRSQWLTEHCLKGGETLSYDLEGVARLEELIHYERTKNNRDQEARLLTLGSWFGECLIALYGGQWIMQDEDSVVLIDGRLTCYPFFKVDKLLHTGADEDSIVRYAADTGELRGVAAHVEATFTNNIPLQWN